MGVVPNGSHHACVAMPVKDPESTERVEQQSSGDVAPTVVSESIQSQRPQRTVKPSADSDGPFTRLRSECVDPLRATDPHSL